jgi:hypothetical protein
VNTTGGFHHKGWLTAEVPNLPDGCRVMNPVPIRLPFDIEVCGREIVYTTNKGSFDFGFVAGVSPDLRWTNEEILAMFNITVSEQCPIREVKLVNIKSDEEMNVNYNNNILLKGVVNGTENGLTIRNNIKVDT